MKLERTQIHERVAVSCTAGGQWCVHERVGVLFAWYDSFYFVGPAGYSLDFAALHLRDVESFIVAVSVITRFPVTRFDERAVANVLRWANNNWHFVKEQP